MQKTAVDLYAQLVETAKRYMWVREVGNNRGAMVDKFNTLLNDSVGHAWCASFVAFCIDEVERKFGVRSGIVKSEGVMDMWNKSRHVQAKFPAPGHIVCWKKKGTIFGHCGIVVEVDPKGEWFQTVEGNTYKDNDYEREGNGVFMKRRYLSGEFPGFSLQGFLDPWK